MCSLNKPGIKNNPYATVSVNRTVVAENGGLFPAGQGFQNLYDANNESGYYSDKVTITVMSRANGEDLYWEIVGAGAQQDRFYQSGRTYGSSAWYTNPDGSTSTTNSLTGRIGPGGASFTKAVYANVTTSNTNDTATSTTFSINIRKGNATTGQILATSSTITCYKFRFVIDIYNETLGAYQNASYTLTNETNVASPSGGTGRQYYCRLLLPTNTVYNTYNLFYNFPSYGTMEVTTPSTGTAITPGTDTSYYMGANGWWDSVGGVYLWFQGGLTKDGVTEGVEYFRFKLNWTSSSYNVLGVGWTYSPDHGIGANTT